MLKLVYDQVLQKWILIFSWMQDIAIYHKPNGSLQLRSKVQVGPVDFRVHAWTLANDAAHQLGWLKWSKAWEAATGGAFPLGDGGAWCQVGRP
jgi:hypothetical protein